MSIKPRPPVEKLYPHRKEASRWSKFNRLFLNDPVGWFLVPCFRMAGVYFLTPFFLKELLCPVEKSLSSL